LYHSIKTLVLFITHILAIYAIFTVFYHFISRGLFALYINQSDAICRPADLGFHSPFQYISLNISGN